MEQKISIQRVIGKLKGDQIERIISEQSPDLRKGDKSWPGAHQKAVTKILAEMEKAREKWTTQGPPLDVRLRLVPCSTGFMKSIL